ncbi:hypothetical protein ES319_D04G216000v1 [Gossypium barbadense]|uniref:Uncharacterized protein n=3 Tax=Gossypium TaxID=3633 RepID=A0A5J5RZ65_GOSBA|nr:hypothetical protein ES319_D04G216000v1 [Gossypium barbadense]PPD67224.1 hypothetical protein GOBAR_DD35891 [Gossypium barbadense]TYG74967.1 hypothetical protein ES288_D04G226500v1 [Gossypium darwinii]
METTQKKKGFFKSKILPKSFSRLFTGTRKVSPSTISNTAQNMTNHSTVPTVMSKQPTGSHQQKAVSYFKSPSFYDHNGFANETWGRGDKNVDSMATTFILNSKEKFKSDGELTH